MLLSFVKTFLRIMMMSEKYSKEDLEAFERKDKLNARMSALKAASTLMDGKGELPTVTLGLANTFYEWLIQGQPYAEIPNTVTEETLKESEQGKVYPVPTVEQLKWLQQIETNYKYSAEQVFDGYGKYPNNKDQAIEAVKKLKKG